MACLLDLALRKLVGSGRMSLKDKTTKSTQPHSLIDIAPAVWNLRYLQTMTAHAQIIPTIAAGIARQRNAQSASLREKLDSINRTATKSNNNEDEFNPEASTACEIKKRLWLLCQTGIRPQPVKRQNTGRRPEEGRTAEHSSQRDVAGPELEHTDGFHSNAPKESDYQVILGHNLHPNHQQEFCDPQLPGAYDCLRADEPCGAEESQQSSEDCTDGSETDYFYADGHGNLYRIERPNAPDSEQFRCPSNRFFAENASHSDDGGQEMVVYGNEDANETYIMYHEVQHRDADAP
ncbi:hypothetical protein MMYC01_200944 [Madurella mycetomatis]|uniref:Uncharacterized protein n=1 Tax=Madurella mycetomatis TaxID=100816 RepID=A0A175WEF6_9PEZI|nr:hypothetical protein MMYC01_200944 [Madurella mycetomatis]